MMPGFGYVKGTVSIDKNNRGSFLPLSCISVYLIDKEFKADTSDFNNNKTSIINSAVTDINGAYKINNIPHGCYSVVPEPGINNYRFSLSAGSNTYSFIVDDAKRGHVIDFTAPEPDKSIAGGSILLNIKTSNLPQKALAGEANLFINIERLYYIHFIPHFFSESCMKLSLKNRNSSVCACTFRAGFSSLAYTKSNNFMLSFIEKENSGKRIESSGFTYYLSLPISGFPSKISIETDWKTRNIKRVM